MLGLIKAERLIHGVQEDITRDMQRMFGAGSDERAFSTILFSIKKRLPWLYVNLATAFLAAAVVALFEGIIAKLTILIIQIRKEEVSWKNNKNFPSGMFSWESGLFSLFITIWLPCSPSRPSPTASF
jgi:hypothetical protein